MKRFLSCFLCLGFVFTLLTCTNFSDESAGLGGVKASVTQLTFSPLSSVQSFSVTSGEKWTVLGIPEWIRVNQISGKGFSWTVSLISEANNGYDRSGVLTLQSSSSTAVVSVSQQGKLGVYVPVESVSLSQQELVITEGETKQLTATVSPSNASVKNVSWKSSSTSVATVSSAGLVTAVAEGTVTITVTTEDGSKTSSCKVTVKKKVISVTGVSLDKASMTLTKGETSQLTATISPSNATNKSVSWESSSTSVATVSSSGLVTAVGAGTASITVTTEDGKKTATCKVTVKIPVTGVTLNKSELTLTEGETGQLTATVSPSNASNKNVSWKSSSTSVATVSSAGLVTAVAEGTATITVTTVDGGKTASCQVTVKKKVIPVTGVSLNKTELALVKGETSQLTATVNPSNATNKNVSWTSSSAAVATVSSSGLVTAVGAGTATITVTTENGNKTATCKVTVKIPVTGVSLDKTELSLTEGDTWQLTAMVTPSDASNKNVSWKSSSPSVAKVSSSGLVSAVSKGTATITVTTEDGSKMATCQVTVKKKVISVTGVSLNQSSMTLVEGETGQLTAMVSPSNATNQNVSWKSSSTSIATVSSSGLVKGVSAGTATITVTTEDGSKTATCRVTVKEKTISVTSVSLDKTTLSLTEGETSQLTATVSPSNATNKNISWRSSSTSIATVSSSGFVTAVSAGTATITVTTEDGSKTATCQVEVRVSVTGVSLSPTSVTLTEGDTYQLSAMVTPSNATNKNVRWQSNATGIVTVSSSGLITAKSQGSATITVITEDGGYAAGCQVTVNKKAIPVTGVSLNYTSLTLYQGGTFQLTATVNPSNATNKNVSWTSSSTSVATVSSSGLVTAKQAGTAAITVWTESGGYTATCWVTVKPSTGYENGHEWVDLGLPSGLKWATCNVGASSPSDYGAYFAWGETSPKNEYSFTNYKWFKEMNGGHSTYSKYIDNEEFGIIDNKKCLEFADDAARVNWGGRWRMPTADELEELRAMCNWTWAPQSGNNGFVVTSKINGNSIFLPAAGYRSYADLTDAGSRGYYWSSNLYTRSQITYCAEDFRFGSGGVTAYSGDYREWGQSVRPVTE